MKSTQEITQEVRELGQWIPALRQQVGHVVIGQKYLVDRLLLGTAGQRSSPARRRSRVGQDAHGENNGRMHSDRFPAIAIHARSYCRQI